MKRVAAWLILAMVGVTLGGCFVEEDGGRGYGGGYGYHHHYYHHDYYH